MPGLESAPGRVYVVGGAEPLSVSVPGSLQGSDGGPARRIRPDPGLDVGTILRGGGPVEVTGQRADIDSGVRHHP